MRSQNHTAAKKKLKQREAHKKDVADTKRNPPSYEAPHKYLLQYKRL